MLKSEVTKVPLNCVCEVKELPNQVKGSSVRSFVDTFTCPICKAINEAQRVEHAKRMSEQKLAQEKEAKLQAKIRELAQKEIDKGV